MYEAQANFLKEFAPSRPLTMVDIVTVDGFFNQSTMKQMGFPTAHFIQDDFHLFDSGLQKMFGKVGYELLKSQLIQMI